MERLSIVATFFGLLFESAVNRIVSAQHSRRDYGGCGGALSEG